MREEEKKAINHLNSFLNIPEYVWIKENELLMVNIKIALNLIENQQKELNNLKEIEQQHKVDNGLLRQELDMQIEHNKELDKVLEETRAENKFDKGLYGLYCREQEKNKELEKYEEAYKLLSYGLNNYISKDKIKEKVEKFRCETTWGYNEQKYDEKIYYAEHKIIDMLEKDLLEEK